MTFDKEYLEQLKKAKEAELAKSGNSIVSAPAKEANDKVAVKVIPESNVKGRKFSKKAPKAQPVGKITEATIKANNKETKMNGTSFKKRNNIKKKLVAGIIVLVGVGGLIFGAKSLQEYANKKAENTNNTEFVDVIKSEDHYAEQVVIDNTVDMMINHYIATNGESEMSAQDAILAYYGANIKTVSPEQLIKSGIAGNISPQEFAKANMQVIMQQKNDARTYGYVADGRQFADSAAKQQYVDYLKIANEVGNENYAAAKNLDEKGLMSGKLSDNHSVNMLGFGIANDVTATQDIINKSAICIDNEKSSTVISQINTSLATDYQNKVTIAITLNNNQIGDGQTLVNLENKINEAYNAKKASVQLKEESNAKTIGGSEIKESESLDKALEKNPNAKVDEKNKTVNLNPGNVKESTDKKSETTYKDNNGNKTTKEDLTKENAKTGDTMVVDGKTYEKGADGKWYEKNTNAGKGVQAVEETTTYTQQSSTSTSTNTQSSTSTQSSSSQSQASSKKEQLEEVKEQVKQQSGTQKTSEKYYDLDGNEYDSEEDLLAAMEAKTR